MTISGCLSETTPSAYEPSGAPPPGYSFKQIAFVKIVDQMGGNPVSVSETKTTLPLRAIFEFDIILYDAVMHNGYVTRAVICG